MAEVANDVNSRVEQLEEALRILIDLHRPASRHYSSSWRTERIEEAGRLVTKPEPGN